MNQEGDLCWFHGKISREFAEQLLNQGLYTLNYKLVNFETIQIIAMRNGMEYHLLINVFGYVSHSIDDCVQL